MFFHHLCLLIKSKTCLIGNFYFNMTPFCEYPFSVIMHDLKKKKGGGPWADSHIFCGCCCSHSTFSFSFSQSSTFCIIIISHVGLPCSTGSSREERSSFVRLCILQSQQYLPHSAYPKNPCQIMIKQPRFLSFLS